MKKYLTLFLVAVVFTNTTHAAFDLSTYSRNTDDNTILLGTWDLDWCDERNATYLEIDDERGDCVIYLDQEHSDGSGNNAIQNAVIWSITNNLLGMKFEEAEDLSRDAEVRLRAAHINGVAQDMTEDEKFGRIDVTVENDVVVRYSMGGVWGIFEKTEETVPEPSTRTTETDLSEAEKKIAMLQQIVALLVQLLSLQQTQS